MSTHASIHHTLYGDTDLKVTLEPHGTCDALMLNINPGDGNGGVCVSGPPERVRAVIAAIAAVEVAPLPEKPSEPSAAVPGAQEGEK